LNRGLKEGWLTIPNPVVGVERFKLPRRKPTFHTEAELTKLLKEARKKGTNLEWAVLLMGWAGLRRNELANLRRENLDFNKKSPAIKIRVSHEFEAKTDERRDIPMNKRIYEALCPHRRDEGYVLESDPPSAGKHRYRYAPRRPLLQALKKAGLRTRNPFQQLRRTFGSILVQRGVSIYEVARWMGHSVRVCERHYADLMKYDEDIDVF
jgi:integrase